MSVALSGCQSTMSLQSNWSIVQLKGSETTEQFVLEQITGNKAALFLKDQRQENVNLYDKHYLAKAPIQPTSGYVFIFRKHQSGAIICLHKPNSHEVVMSVQTSPLALVSVTEKIGSVRLMGYCEN